MQLIKTILKKSEFQDFCHKERIRNRILKIEKPVLKHLSVHLRNNCLVHQIKILLQKYNKLKKKETRQRMFCDVIACEISYHKLFLRRWDWNWNTIVGFSKLFFYK